MAEKKEHDIDYTDPEEEKKEKVSSAGVKNGIGGVGRSEEGNWRGEWRVHFQDEGQALQIPRWAVEGKRYWQLQVDEAQGDQEDQSLDETGENSQTSLQFLG